MVLKLNFSTCPNDTFMFGALVNGLIDTKGYRFDVHLADIEELNSMAVSAYPDISKLSFGAFPYVVNKYQLLNSGSALGKGVGPLVVSKRKIYPDEVKYSKVALPGERTTAHLLFNMAFPDVKVKRFYLFSEIMDVVLSNEADVGVIIHESRFTYEGKGLLKIVDLGDFWEKKTSMPTPLGGIAIKKDFPDSVKLDINTLIYESINFAFKNPQMVMPYVKQYAKEMDVDVMQKHIDLYVNNHSLSLNEDGRKAIEGLLGLSGNIKFNIDTDIFIKI